MGAALSIAVLFTVSSTIVRVASVVLEHSGIPMSVARIQALSALSGTGFTTTESEMILLTPVRRKVLATLMIAGSIGLASIAATIVVGAFGVSKTPNGLAGQVAAIAAAIVYGRYILLSPRVDAFVCGFAYRWLEREGEGRCSFTVVHRLAEDWLIAEHLLREDIAAEPAEWSFEGLTPLGVRDPVSGEAEHPWSGARPERGQALVLLGPIAAHSSFADRYGSTAFGRGH